MEFQAFAFNPVQAQPLWPFWRIKQQIEDLIPSLPLSVTLPYIDSLYFKMPKAVAHVFVVKLLLVLSKCQNKNQNFLSRNYMGIHKINIFISPTLS